MPSVKPTSKSTKPAPRALAQLLIVLQGVDPPVWRRLLVPTAIRLDKLHRVLQVAMGWTNSHLHEFTIGHNRFGVPDPDWPDAAPVLPDNKSTLADALGGSTKFTYVYDFGDDWTHDVRVEAVLASDSNATVPLCLEGARACPPEDVGGPPGYAEFLKTINDPRDPDHEDLLEWCGGAFDPTQFSVDAVNKALRRLKV